MSEWHTDDLYFEDDTGADKLNERFIEECRLVKCYRLSTFDDKKVIWTILGKYAKNVDLISQV